MNGPEIDSAATFSVESEQSVLGGLMLDNAAWDRIADTVCEADFFTQDHRAIFRAIFSLVERGQPADAVTVSEALQLSGSLEKIGGMGYVGALAQNTPSAANIRRYAEIVRERSVMRQLLAAAQEIADSVRRPGGRQVKELLDHAQARMMAVSDGQSRGGGFARLSPSLAAALTRIDELAAREHSSDVIGLATGFTDLDRRTAGFHPSDLVIIAGRPSMGKTAMALGIAEHVALAKHGPVAIFSMEMQSVQLAVRFLSSVARLNQHRVRIGRLYDAEWPKLSDAAGKLHQAPIYIDETGALTPLELRARARRLHRECGGLALIVVDYIQLMAGSDENANRANQISEVSRSLKALAKELNLPVVALSQLNRGVDARPNKRPIMSDLRDSGAIEQDADVILFIYRDEVYRENSEDKGTAEIIIGKQRNGPTGTVRLAFHAENTRFENLTQEAEDRGIPI